MRAIAAYQQMTNIQEVERKVWSDEDHDFVTRRIKISQPAFDEKGKPVLKRLSASILVLNRARNNRYVPGIGSVPIGNVLGYTSLHKAKNVIRRYYGIESRRLMAWEG